MFPILSFALNWLLRPSTWIVILLFWAILTPKKRKGILIAAFAVFYLFSNPFLISIVYKSWSYSPYPYDELQRTYPCAIILGGATKFGLKPEDRVHSGMAIDRVLHSGQLYQLQKVKKFVVTGGTSLAYEKNDSSSEAQNMGKLLQILGVEERDIFFEDKALNTYQNAVFSKALLDSLGVNDTVLLVTSAFHMPRALATFEAQGVAVRPFPTDIRALGVYSWQHYLIPDPEWLWYYQVIIKEMVGMLAYRFMGYI